MKRRYSTIIHTWSGSWNANILSSIWSFAAHWLVGWFCFHVMTNDHNLRSLYPPSLLKLFTFSPFELLLWLFYLYNWFSWLTPEFFYFCAKSCVLEMLYYFLSFCFLLSTCLADNSSSYMRIRYAEYIPDIQSKGMFLWTAISGWYSCQFRTWFLNFTVFNTFPILSKIPF